MNQDHREVRLLLGAYLLGGLDPTDRATFETHLAGCALCRDELSQSAALPGLLRRVDNPGRRAVEQPDPETRARQLRVLMHRRARLRRRRLNALVGVAAASVAAAVAAGLVFAPPLLRPSTPAAATVVELRPANSGGAGQAVLDPRPWGTSVTLTATGLPTQGPFALEVTGRSGSQERAASWGITSDGRVHVVGATSLTPDAIRQIQILGPDGPVAQSE